MNNILLSNGNKKLGRDSLILNMTSATDCPSKARGLCKLCRVCYAMKAERQYPAVLPYRRRQAKQWRALTAGEISAGILAIARRKRKKIRFLRVSEAGDFSSQADVDKLSKIAEHLASEDIRVYTYTARADLDFTQTSSNLTVNGSGFMVDNEFKAEPKPKAGAICPGDCRSCNLCKTRGRRLIKVKIH